MMLYPRVSLYALMLAAAGIPLYIHLPRYASINLGIGLGAIGTILMSVRLVDLVQDPLLGWCVDRWPNLQKAFALLAAIGLGLGFLLLFTVHPEPMATGWLVTALILLFTAYSMGMILLYGRSATLANEPTPGALMTLAGYREAGMLAGVIIAAIAPTVFSGLGFGRDGYPAFGLFLAGIALIAAWLTRPIWQRPPLGATNSVMASLAHPDVLRLLIIALINSLPVAMTSTLFLFFVEDHLMLPGYGGPFLILFFLCAGLSVPLWTRLAKTLGAKRTLCIAMPLSVLGFVGAAFLAPGHVTGFALICAASGAALGADMVILPALFSITLTRANLKASTAFGIWSFVGKLGLAMAAFLVLPVLGANGFKPGEINNESALATLVFLYAVIPCILKLCAFGLVLMLLKEDHVQ